MGKKKTTAVFGLILCLALSGCARDNRKRKTVQKADERVCVATTLFPYYDFVRQIAGDRVKLKLVIPAGMDSHSFEPTPADLLAIQDSDIFFYNGGEMEQWVDKALSSIDCSGLYPVSLIDCVDVLEEEVVEGMEEEDEESYSLHEPGELGEIEYDEHIWTSPKNAKIITEKILDVLTEQDPGNQEIYRENGRRYLEELEQLDEKFCAVMEERKRDRIVVGDRFPFRYLAESYHIQYRAAFPGCGGDTEPSARTIAYLIEQVRELDLPAVYYLELSSHRVAEIIGEETKAVPLLLHSCHNVTRKEFEEGITYLQLMEQNLVNLRFGLDADAEGGREWTR